MKLIELPAPNDGLNERHADRNIVLFNFSVRQLLPDSESSAQLKCDPLGGGGGGSEFGVRSIGSGETHFNSSRSDNFACPLTSNKPLDETHLFSVLKLNLECALNDHGAQITESGSSGSGNFYFAYSLKGVRGRVELSGQRGAADYYNITANLSESGS
jgi:hypothetical protein